MKKKLTINLLNCPHCGEEIMIGYTKKALKKILKTFTVSADMVVGLEAVMDSDGSILYHVSGEV